MPPKIQKRRDLGVSAEATKILGTVRDEEAFYFYEAIGKPTGENARSLSDFLEKIKSVTLESLLFHLQRKTSKLGSRKLLVTPNLPEKWTEYRLHTMMT